jgi:hypothetical protein
MCLRAKCLFLFVMLAVSGLTSRVSSAQDVPSDDDSAICRSLCAIPDAPWRSIPWELDLLEAQRKAVESSKPIFIWAMDGHPLGCT